MLHSLGAFVGVPIGVVMLRKGWVDCEGWDLLSLRKNGRPTRTPLRESSGLNFSHSSSHSPNQSRLVWLPESEQQARHSGPEAESFQAPQPIQLHQVNKRDPDAVRALEADMHTLLKQGSAFSAYQLWEQDEDRSGRVELSAKTLFQLAQALTTDRHGDEAEVTWKRAAEREATPHNRSILERAQIQLIAGRLRAKGILSELREPSPKENEIEINSSSEPTNCSPKDWLN